MSPGASLGLSEPKSPEAHALPACLSQPLPLRPPQTAKRPMSPGASLGLSEPKSAARPAMPPKSLNATPSRSPPTPPHIRPEGLPYKEAAMLLP
jgi:hypothetical protein